jgi:hypothetical protein
MLTPVEVKALTDFRLWLRYSDGVSGTVDLSPLAGKGVFALWNDPQQFASVHIGALGGIAWSEEVELCPDELYMEITGKSPEELFPALLPKAANA